ncbi:SA1362 family protein [Bacillus cereus group sp. BfR-BA-01380]|uniref:SA1362 family protein n=1 Tax=Bacillus cereus group sp. BfR-BA-01380 TaxID=2920324 RepID=UPI001F595962|nr:SA1362 family protein [Bacillus cereus group sp. BfR-BA-01380]
MNGRSFMFALFVVIVGLAIFNLVSFTIEDPMGVVKNIVIMLIVVGVFYLLYKMLTSSSSSANSSQSSYKRAAKQSNRKYGKQNVTPLSNNLLKKSASDTKGKKGNTSFLKRKRKQSHLTVIEGKKGKKKDRASF